MRGGEKTFGNEYKTPEFCHFKPEPGQNPAAVGAVRSMAAAPREPERLERRWNRQQTRPAHLSKGKTDEENE